MCKACWECIKCPGKVVCCCCKCACNMLMGIVFSVIGLLIIIGLIVYFTVFFHKGNNDTPDEATVKALVGAVTPSTFRDYFQKP